MLCTSSDLKTLVVSESWVRYDDKNDFFKQQPDKSSYDQASKCKVMGYAHVAQDLSQMKAGHVVKEYDGSFRLGNGLSRPLRSHLNKCRIF